MDSAMDGKEIVDKMQEALRSEIPPITYVTFLEPLEFESMEGNHITFKCNSRYEKEMAESRYATLILNALKFITSRDLTFSINALDEKKQNQNPTQDQPQSQPQEVIASSKPQDDEEIDYSRQSLNPKYTFDTFVVGNNNRLAQAAALAVADNPAKTYNPLFIYGGVGLGKTHLIQAIGNRILQNDRKKNVVYVTSEKFTNQLIISIKDFKNDPFRNKYRTADVLIIDDIQFIDNKERFQ